MFIPSTFKRPVSSWKALNLRKTLLMASSVRLKPLNCSRLPCVYAQETLTFLLIFVCLSMVQLMAVFISMRCTLCGHFLQVALTLILVVGYAIAASYIAVGFYVAKYVNKKSDMDLAAKGLGAKEWNNSLKTKLSLLPKKLFRIRMSRNFGMKMLTMTNLSTECLIQLTKLGYDATPFNQILKQNAKREMRLRLGKVTVADVLAAQPVTTNLLKFMRASIK